MLLPHRAARTHLVVPRDPKYFLRRHSAGSVLPGSGRPVRHIRLRPGDSPQTLRTPPHGGRPVLRQRPQDLQGPGDRQKGRPVGSARSSQAFPDLAPMSRHHKPALSTSPQSLLSRCRPARRYPRLWLRNPLGAVRLDLNQLGTCAARRTLRAGPPLCPAPVLCPSRCPPLGALPLAARGPTSPISTGRHYRGDRFSCSMPAPATSSRHLYTGHHQGNTQAAPWLRARSTRAFVPGSEVAPGSDAIFLLFDASAVVRSCSSSRRLPAPVKPGLFPQRSRPRLLTGAACGGLGPPPARRARRANLHHWHSTPHVVDLLHRRHSAFRTHTSRSSFHTTT